MGAKYLKALLKEQIEHSEQDQFSEDTKKFLHYIQKLSPYNVFVKPLSTLSFDAANELCEKNASFNQALWKDRAWIKRFISMVDQENGHLASLLWQSFEQIKGADQTVFEQLLKQSSLLSDLHQLLDLIHSENKDKASELNLLIKRSTNQSALLNCLLYMDDHRYIISVFNLLAAVENESGSLKKLKESMLGNPVLLGKLSLLIDDASKANDLKESMYHFAFANEANLLLVLSYSALLFPDGLQHAAFKAKLIESGQLNPEVKAKFLAQANKISNKIKRFLGENFCKLLHLSLPPTSLFISSIMSCKDPEPALPLVRRELADASQALPPVPIPSPSAVFKALWSGNFNLRMAGKTAVAPLQQMVDTTQNIQSALLKKMQEKLKRTNHVASPLLLQSPQEKVDTRVWECPEDILADVTSEDIDELCSDSVIEHISLLDSSSFISKKTVKIFDEAAQEVFSSTPADKMELSDEEEDFSFDGGDNGRFMAYLLQAGCSQEELFETYDELYGTGTDESADISFSSGSRSSQDGADDSIDDFSFQGDNSINKTPSVSSGSMDDDKEEDSIDQTPSPDRPVHSILSPSRLFSHSNLSGDSEDSIDCTPSLEEEELEGIVTEKPDPIDLTPQPSF